MSDEDRSAALLLLLLLLLLPVLLLLLRLTDCPVDPVDPSLVEGTGTTRPALVLLELDAAFLVPIAAEGWGVMVVVAERGAGRKRSWLLGPFRWPLQLELLPQPPPPMMRMRKGGLEDEF